MKASILLISTNKYNSFLKPCIDSINKFFCKDLEKEFIIFSDDERITKQFDNSFFYPIEHDVWPFITLKRYQIFKAAYEKIKDSDMVIYFDVDLEVVREVNLDFSNIDIFGVQHPGIYREANFFPVETNVKSTACLNPLNLYTYHQGCLWGAKKNEFLKLNDTLIENVNEDLKNNVIAAWHDESHLNKYFYDNRQKITTLSSSFCYPENWNLPCEKIIIHKDKNMKEYPRFEGANQNGKNH